MEQTPDYYLPLYEDLLDRMVEGGWVEKYTFTTGKGFDIAWTETGARQSGLLKSIVTSFKLAEDPHSPRMFDLAAHDEAPHEIPPQMTRYWCQCIDLLEIDREGMDVMGLVHIVANWAPDFIPPSQRIK